MHRLIAAIARASAANRKRWRLLDVRRCSITAQPPHRYRIGKTAFDEALLAEDVERGEEDLTIEHQTQYFAADTSKRYTALACFGTDPDVFAAPWRVDDPL